MKKFKKFIILIIGLSLVLGSGYWLYQDKLGTGQYQTSYEKNNKYVRFDMEIFDIISNNFWQKVDEAELGELYRLSFAKAASTTPVNLATTTRTEIASMLNQEFGKASSEKRKDLALNTGVIVLANLAPQGRSGLLSQKEETAFRDNVNNVDRDKNLYNSLGLVDGADTQKVEQAYEEKIDELKNDLSPEVEVKRKELTQAHEILSDENSKAIYDETKSEPTLASNTLSGGSLYLDLSKISNTTLQEVANRLAEFDDQNHPNGLIIDLRNNVGGSLDFAKYFFAFFVGPNQYAYDLFHQGELQPERTPAIAKVSWLSQVPNIAVLTDGNSQSTAELLTATFKRFNLAKVVGEKTKGWGTVENTFPVETDFGDGNKFSVLLVHSLTISDDGESIEGRGVEPDVDISTDNWRNRLSKTFQSTSFVRDVISAISTP